jgi:AbrB family looped-hinge helix DNA binding protein
MIDKRKLRERNMETSTSRVTSKGQVVIPKKLREKYGISTSSAVRWIEQDRGILMVPESEDPIVAARGMLEGSGLLRAYLKEKRLEKERENKQVGRSE